MGDPALDIGYYLADLWWLASKSGHEQLRPHGPRFLEQYLAEVNGGSLFERAILYEVFSYARLVLKKLRRDDLEERLEAETIFAQASARLAIVAG